MPDDESRPLDIVRASEIGEYVHCHRAWWLGRVQGVENANWAQLDTGTERHRAHGRSVRRAAQLQLLAWALVAVAALAALLLVLSWAGLV